MSDILLGLKVLTVPIDTNVLILAGITAEKVITEMMLQNFMDV